MNQTLQAFYDAYGAWLKDGAPKGVRVNDQGECFDHSYGLCSSLGMFMNTLKYTDAHLAMSSQFRKAGLDEGYPFGGREKYRVDKCNKQMHLNPARRKWVFEHMTKE